MSNIPKEHAADAAGGEIIYSSDGMEPLPAVRPPTTLVQSESYDFDTVESSQTSMTEAFLRFTSILKENPKDRLLRLQQEAIELQNQVQDEPALVEQVKQLLHRLNEQQEFMHRKKKSIQVADQEEVTVDLEALLLRLEKTVGSVSSKPLVDRVGQLEFAMSHLDERHLEQAAKQAKVIRQDLEAASKARNKLMMSDKDSSSKTITALYDTMMSLQDVSKHLPALTQRLQVLSQHHVQAATWNARLVALEDAVGRMSTQLQGAEAAVQRLETTWPEMEQRLQASLDVLNKK
jgi:hypothetical protein